MARVRKRISPPKPRPRGRVKRVSFLSRLARGLWVALGLLALFAIVDVGRYAVWPDVAALNEEKPDKTAFMRWREAQWAETGRDKTIQWTWTPLARIPTHVVLAVTIAEDDKFWHHDGFDFPAMEQALRRNIEVGRVAAGGSTITQQLAKNLYLSPSKSPLRKAKEAILTYRLERVLHKQRILELYLNVAEWGDGVFGIEAAARHHYKVSASALTPRQAAYLAAVLPNPLALSPTSPSPGVSARARIYLSRMQRRL